LPVQTRNPPDTSLIQPTARQPSEHLRAFHSEKTRKGTIAWDSHWNPR